MLKKLHKRNSIVYKPFEPEEGERSLLCSNKDDTRSPSLDLEITSQTTRQELIGILAKIIVEGFLWEHNHAKQYSKEGSNILSGVDKRTG